MGARNRVWFFLFVLFLCFSLNTHLSNGAGTLSAGEFISGDQTIVSEGNGSFKLGFFTPGNNSKHYYIGVWYKKISEEMMITWVANRNKPLSSKNASQLKLLEDGNLVILDSSKTFIWSTNLTSKSLNSTEAAVLDSGNLVLREISNSSALIWDSFDHPVHTWLPGGRTRLIKVTNKSQNLTSWKNISVISPASAPSSTGSTPLYNLTPWNNYSVISPVLAPISISPATAPRPASTPLYLCGAFAVWIEQASIPCECLQGFSPRHPTANSNLSDTGGCVRNTPLQCANNASVNGGIDGFLTMSNMKWPTSSEYFQGHVSVSCELMCLQRCSCNAYAYDYGTNEGVCYLWEGDLLNLEQFSGGDTGGQDIYIKLAGSNLLNSTFGGNKKRSATGSIAGAVSGILALLGLLVVAIWIRQRRKLVGPWEAAEGFLVPFSYRDLHITTKNFSEKLGGGGFGPVFKGTLPDSTFVAVKKLEGFSQGEKQFRAEVSTIGTIQHVNLVCLRGFCSEDTKRLLVYDFMPNGSLDSHLFHGKKDTQILDWKTRYQIALGTARGLSYLHEKCRDCIIHCDIKPDNILLDTDFCPKVADFGLSKLVGRDFSRVLTTIRGTIGYLAPEWISGVAITEKADVYSYGMMLFELISGKRNSNQSNGETVEFFPIWAVSKINEGGEILDLLDYRLEGNADLAELNRACKVASWCIQDDKDHRPSMGLVVQTLEGIVEFSTPPIPRILQALAENHDHKDFFLEPSSNQSLQAQSHTSGTSYHPFLEFSKLLRRTMIT